MLSGVKVETLVDMTVHRFAPALQGVKGAEDGSTDRLLSPASISRAVSRMSSKYCGRCLLMNGPHHKTQWDLLHVTSCPDHYSLLVDRCLGCQKRITHVEIVRGRHACGRSLLLGPFGNGLLQDREGMEAQAYVQGLLGLYPSPISGGGDPGFDLPAPSFFWLLECLSSLLCGVVGRPGILAVPEQMVEKFPKSWKNLMSNLNRHVLVRESFKILRDWPHRFFAFLDLFRSVGGDTYFAGLSHEYRPLQILLYRLKGEEFGFVHDAFRKYVTRVFTGGAVRRTSRFNAGEDERRYVGIEEAADMLGIGYGKAAALVRLGKLETITIPARPRRIYLVSRDSVETWLQKLKSMLTIGQVAKRLRTRVTMVNELVETGFMMKERLTHQWSLIPESEVRDFERRFLDGPRGTPVPGGPSRVRLHSSGLSGSTAFFTTHAASKLLHLVDSGALPMDVKLGRGLHGVAFDPVELNRVRLLLTMEDKQIGDLEQAAQHDLGHCPEAIEGRGKQVFFSPYRASRLIGVPRSAFNQLRSLGILGEPRSGRVAGEAIVKFRTRYVSLHEACAIYGLRKKLLFRWLYKGKLQMAAVLATGARLWSFVERREIVELLGIGSMSLSDVAKRLRVNPSSVQNLILTGVLRVVRGVNDQLFAVRRDFFRIAEASAVILPRETLAAELEIDVQVLRDLIQENALPLHSRWVNVFTGVDLLILRKTHSVRETARLLGASPGAVIKWMKLGRLRATSGTADGSRGYLFRMVEIKIFERERRAELSLGKKKMSLSAVSLKDAAALLGIEERDALRLMMTSAITPLGGPGTTKRREYTFPRSEVLRLKARRDEGIVSGPEAAAILGVRPNHFHKTYIRSGLLVPVPYENRRGKYFFRRSDVETLAKSVDAALTVDQAAKVIRVTSCTVRKWARAGKLRAISGPSVNGCRFYLFDPKDVQAKKQLVKGGRR